MIVSFFHSSPLHLRAVPGLGTRLRYAGIRHLEMDALVPASDFQWCVDEDWRLILTGDSFMRTPGDWARHCHERTVRDKAKMYGESGRVDGIEMVDEVGNDPRMYEPHCSNFVKWWRKECSIPISWPGFSPSRWESLGDYDSCQWQWFLRGTTRQDRLERMRLSLYGHLPGRELCAHVNLAIEYQKRSLGGLYNPKFDRALQIPPTLDNIDKQFEIATRFRADRIRIYGLDLIPEWPRDRRDTPVGSSAYLQQGTGLWDHRWPGIEMILREVTKGVRV